MAQPENNGLFEVNSNRKVVERGFFCMMLVDFLNEEATMGTEEYASLWDERFDQAKAGACAYRERCPIYSKTVKNKPIQLKLF